MCYYVCGYNRATKIFTRKRFFATLGEALETALAETWHKRYVCKTAKHQTMLVFEQRDGEPDKVIIDCPCFPMEKPKKRGRKKGSRLMRD